MGFFPSEEEQKAKRQQKLNKLLFKSDAEKIRAALAAGAEPEVAQNKDGWSPLYVHASAGNLACLSALLAHGVHPDNGTPKGTTPLVIAVRNNNPECMKALVEAGADLNAQPTNGGFSALHWAAYWGHGNNIQYLLDKGIDRNLVDQQMNTAADIADKHNYPRLGDLIRGKPRVENKPAPEKSNGWHKTAVDEIARVTEKEAVGYRLTEMFNFKTGMYTQIAANMTTGAESQSMRSFDEFTDTALIREALAELTRKGGKVDTEMSARIAQKPSLGTKQFGTGG